MLNDSLLDYMKRRDIPITRQSYIDVAFLGEPPQDWSVQDEALLPEELQDWNLFEWINDELVYIGDGDGKSKTSSRQGETGNGPED